MFGYILPDKPNMFMKDYALYKCFYCGLCKSIRDCQGGNLLRLSVNYDVTFINILLHGITGQKMEFKAEGCILNPIKKKAVLVTDPISTECVYLNTLLADFKLKDDLKDKPSRLKRSVRKLFAKKVKKARRELPEVAELLDKAYEAQAQVESLPAPSFDQSAAPFAECMQGIFQALLGDKFTDEIGDLAFFLAKYVYLLDAIDDYDKDIKDGQFNPFRSEFHDCKSRSELLVDHGDKLDEILNGLIFGIKQAYENVAVFNTESIITNTLWYGLAARAKVIFDKENKKCVKTHTKF